MSVNLDSLPWSITERKDSKINKRDSLRNLDFSICDTV